MESSISNRSNTDSDIQLPACISDRKKTFNKTRPHVKVMAKYKGGIITGEGFNIRTAKLQVAQQLGIDTC